MHEGGLTCLALEATEERYLIGAATDSSFAIYDTAQASGPDRAKSCLCKVDRTKREGHKYSVSCAAWYPVDSGLFVTGSYDRDVKVRHSFSWSELNILAVEFGHNIFAFPLSLTNLAVLAYVLAWSQANLP